MSATAPWSVKGIDPKAREIAKDLARRSGMTLGEWLNSMIMDEPEDDGVTPLPRRSAIPDPYDRRARRRRLDDAYEGQSGNEGINALILELGERLEEAERRSASAIQGIDQAVAGLMRRMDTSREQDSQRERRLDDVARELRDGHQRLKQLEAREAGAGADDLKARLDRAQDATHMALQGLERSFAALDKRLGSLEARPSHDDGQLAQLAETLGRQIEANRQDMLSRLEKVGDTSRLARAEQTLGKLVRQTAAAELKSARAVEAMGHEIMRIAQNMNGRMQTLEQASASENSTTLDMRLAELGRVLDEKLDREIARHSQSVENRLSRQEDQNALALERLGGEITRISDRLSERISQTERRSTQAIDDIGRRLAESSEKLERRSEDVSGEMAERLRQSEERTRRLLEEAREVRARREAAAHHAAPRLTSAAPPAAMAFDDVPDFIADDQPAVSLFGAAPTDEWLPQQAEPDDWRASALATNPIDAPLPEAQATDGWADTVAAEMAVEPFPTHDDLRPFGSLEDELDTDASPVAEADDLQADAEADDFPSIFASSGHELAADQSDADTSQAVTDAIDEQVFAEPAQIPAHEREAAESFLGALAAEMEASQEAAEPSTRDVIDQARAAIVDDVPEVAPRKTFGLGKLRKKGGTSALQQKLDRKAARDGSTVGQALKVSALAMLVVGGGGYGTLKLLKDQDIDFGQAASAPPAAPMAALALDATPTDAVPSKEVAETEGAAIFKRAELLLDNGDMSGLEPMKRAAELGYVPAQMRLAAIYTEGAAGIEADVVEARAWVRRAAEAGEPKAMQHYATLLYDGTGGERDEKSAVYWMRKSAEAGRVDSQYNVAHLYEKGVKGGPANKIEAMTWYMIAARRGDQQALAAIQRLTPELKPEQRAAARNAADNFTVPPVS
ncbi:SEL1-like repeat protein [Brevundimonas sp. GN22]